MRAHSVRGKLNEAGLSLLIQRPADEIRGRRSGVRYLTLASRCRVVDLVGGHAYSAKVACVLTTGLEYAKRNSRRGVARWRFSQVS